MANRHKNGVLYLDMESLLELVQEKVYSNRSRHGPFSSTHEIYAVLQEELDKYWDSVKLKDPDPTYLISLASATIDATLNIALKAKEDKEST